MRDLNYISDWSRDFATWYAFKINTRKHLEGSSFSKLTSFYCSKHATTTGSIEKKLAVAGTYPTTLQNRGNCAKLLFVVRSWDADLEKVFTETLPNLAWLIFPSGASCRFPRSFQGSMPYQIIAKSLNPVFNGQRSANWLRTNSLSTKNRSAIELQVKFCNLKKFEAYLLRRFFHLSWVKLPKREYQQ